MQRQNKKLVKRKKAAKSSSSPVRTDSPAGSNRVGASASDRINILDIGAPTDLAQLERVRLNDNEIAVIPFTTDVQRIDLHYCDETAINDYVPCNGADCVLCTIGRKAEERILMPVYLPTAGAIGVLPVSPSFRPHALLPQLVNAMKATKPIVVFVKREKRKYVVSTADLKADTDSGEERIREFMQEYEANRIDLRSVYTRIDNEQLANITEIARMLTLKG